MYGKKKMGMRQKALEGMMSEDAPIAKKRPMEMEEQAEEGMESILVTAEEREMIMEMRGEDSMEEPEEGEEYAENEQMAPKTRM